MCVCLSSIGIEIGTAGVYCLFIARCEVIVAAYLMRRVRGAMVRCVGTAGRRVALRLVGRVLRAGGRSLGGGRMVLW